MDRHARAMELLKKGTVIPATPLALREDRTFDEAGQRLLMRYYLDCGVGGIATAVHTTQFEIRDPKVNLYESVLKTVSEEIDAYEKRTGKSVVRVAGACGPTEQAVAEAKLAKRYGFDAVLLSPGGLQTYSEEYLVERTKAVGEIMPVIGFYLQEACGGRAFTYQYWQQIAEIPCVAAIKCAAFNRYQTLDVVRAVAFSSRREEIALYTGNDDNIVVDMLTNYEFAGENGEILRKDFRGGLLGHWTVWTRSVVELFEKLTEAKQRGTIDAELLTLAAQVTDANAALFDPAHKFAGCIPGVHEALRRQGLMAGTWCLNANEKLSPGQAEEIDRVLKAYPWMTDDDFVRRNMNKWQSQ